MFTLIGHFLFLSTENFSASSVLLQPGNICLEIAAEDNVPAFGVDVDVVLELGPGM